MDIITINILLEFKFNQHEDLLNLMTIENPNCKRTKIPARTLLHMREAFLDKACKRYQNIQDENNEYNQESSI